MGCFAKIIKLFLTILIFILGIKLITKISSIIISLYISIYTIQHITIFTAIILTLLVILVSILILWGIWNFLSSLYRYLF